jgi:hypothetical protein
MHLNTNTARGRLLRLLVVCLVAAWWTTGVTSTVVHAWECGDFSCDNDEGENHTNCPADCDAACGNDFCEEGETCGGCPEDCFESCVCGDSVCNWPAEGGGFPNSNCDEAASSYPEVECEFCPQDCGQCEDFWCFIFEGGVCADDGGCRPCDPYAWEDECPQPDYYCDGGGQCVPRP